MLHRKEQGKLRKRTGYERMLVKEVTPNQNYSLIFKNGSYVAFCCILVT